MLPSELTPEARAALEKIKQEWLPPANDAPKLIVLDPGHGNFVLDYQHERDEVEIETTRRVKYKGKWHSQTTKHNGLHRYRGATLMWPNGDGTFSPHEHYDGKSPFPAGTYFDDPGTQTKVRHYKGETLVRADLSEYEYDGKGDIARGTWLRSPAPSITKTTPSRIFTVSENDINLAVSLKLAEELRSRGFEVQLTRHSPSEILASRFEARIETGIDNKLMHLSVHTDDNPSRNFGGLHGYYHYTLPETSTSASFASALADSKSGTPWERSAMLNPDVMGTTIPAAIIEMGNIRNPTDQKRLVSEAGQRETAQKIADRVVCYYEDNQVALHQDVAKRQQAEAPLFSPLQIKYLSLPQPKIDFTVPLKRNGPGL